jgi:hypothetical protein
MAVYILLFKNFDKTDITFDFEILPEKREVSDGKIIELNDGECTFVCRSFVEEFIGKIYYQYLISNNNDIVSEKLTDTFLMRM